ncbi:MAG TPA: YncE family protein [Terriglobales bacterium]|nr:YncE family protein [Terriglobales bacterium]
MRLKLLIVPLVLVLWSAATAAQLRQVAILDLPGRPGFDAIALASGRVVIAHAGAGTVDIFDPARRRLVAQIGNLDHPRGLAVDEPGRRLFIADAGNRTISTVSTNTWKVENQFPLSSSPDALLFAPAANMLYATNWHDGSVSAVDPVTGQARTVAVGGRPADLLFDPASHRLYITVQGRNYVLITDSALNARGKFPLAGSLPTGVALDAANRKLFIAVRYAVVVLDLDSGSELARVPMPAGTDMLWYDDSSQSLYTAANGGIVSVIRRDGARYFVEQELVTEVRGHTLAFDAERQFIYVPGGRDGRSKLVILRRFDNPAHSRPPQTALR